MVDNLGKNTSTGVCFDKESNNGTEAVTITNDLDLRNGVIPLQVSTLFWRLTIIQLIGW